LIYYKILQVNRLILVQKVVVTDQHSIALVSLGSLSDTRVAKEVQNEQEQRLVCYTAKVLLEPTLI
jgi:hypothetical protein